MIWRPSMRRVAQTNLDRFMAGHRDYDSLWRWSVENRDEFWTAIWRFCGVKASHPYTAVTEPAEGVHQVTWFPGARLNFAENLLRYNDDSPAIIAWNESGRLRTFTHHELHQQVSRVAQALYASGVRTGDRVAAWLPNIPETVIAMLATASLGAIWSSCSPDFGVQGVLDRFSQIEPKVLIAADGVQYNGKRLDTLGRLAEIAKGLPTLKLTIVVTLDDLHPDLSAIPHAIRWQDEILFYPPKPLTFAQLPFEHPLYILFSSGTTGLPKCMVHGAGGTLVQHLKEHVLHTDVKPNDRVFYHTTCGWMMWNWLVGVLATGACIVLYDGSPVYPRQDVLWDMAAASRVTIFGTSAKYLMLMQKAGSSPRSTHDLSALRTVLSTGSPLPFESWEYIYSHVHPDIQVSSISGGTDIVSCFALGNPVGPVYRGEIQVRGLGMHVEVFNQEGQPVIGEKGELVCHPPFPSMPLYFWNDPGEAKYRAAYFERFPGVWCHGDWAEITPRGGVIISGRSDTTLNPGGVRIGTAEIYRQVELVDEVLESLVIGLPIDNDVEIALFVKLRPGVELTPDLKDRLCRQIRTGASPHHVPRHIFPVSDLPRTVSGKLSEVAVRETIQGRPVKNTSALANPECLVNFISLPFVRKP
ncbi:acetoacetate--CoA ligase [Paludibaculum fermentans]|uniref:Acetoacetate--CoA ligase n=1 Tax=Paludibaculum fermentans TaxID=1473598 RepID=A0A7S7NLU0_PALFE|nr:acetoacetate--CoA ligase [Paludibaculum fermentans]QOY85935.1 acetoacetate--CoA ligase [Paludibaculum fermentans]